MRQIAFLTLCVFLSSCAVINATVTLPDGKVAHVTGVRFFVSSEATIEDETSKVKIHYGAKTESDKIHELLQMLAPILAAAKVAGGVPIP